MLNYQNIISDPYPDTRDPVTGDWLPKSYNDVKADSMRAERERAQKGSLSQALELFSMIK